MIPFQSILDKCPTRLPPRLKWCPEESTLSWLSFQTGARSNGRSRSKRVFGIEEDIEVYQHLVVRAVGKVGWIHLVFALSAGEALPVVAPWLRDLLLRLKHLEQQLFVKLGALVPIFPPFPSIEGRHPLHLPRLEVGCSLPRARLPSTCARTCTSSSSCSRSGQPRVGWRRYARCYSHRCLVPRPTFGSPKGVCTSCT